MSAPTPRIPPAVIVAGMRARDRLARLIRVATAAASAAAALSLSAGAVIAAEPILPLSEVRPGMVGEARTVVRGTEIGSFTVTVIDVIRAGDGPGNTHILARASGPLLQETGGVADGMSGSPVYVTGADGVTRVIGAVALGTGDEGSVVVGVTPIEQMIDSSSGLRANERPVRAASKLVRRAVLVDDRRAARALEVRRPDRIAFYPLTRWSVAGVSRPLPRPLATRLDGAGIRLASIGSRTRRPPVPLVPGASLSVLLAAGDVSVSAIGAVTWVDGPTVLGFGHSLIAGGRARFLMGDAYVYGNVPAPLGGWSYKLAEPGGLQGVVLNDRADGVTGRVGPSDGIAVLSTARHPARGAEATLRGTLAPDERTVADVAWLYQDEGAFRVTDGAARGTLTLTITIAGPDLPQRLRYRNVYASGENVAWMASGQLSALLYVLTRNDLKSVAISKVTVSQALVPGVRAARIVGVGVRRRGGSARRAVLVLRVEPWRSRERAVTVPITLPAGVTRSSPRIAVVPKSVGGFSPTDPALYAGYGYSVSGRTPAKALRRLERHARRSTGTRLERVLGGMAQLTDDRHDAIRLLTESDDPDDPASGVTVPVPYVIYDGFATTRVPFPARR